MTDTTMAEDTAPDPRVEALARAMVDSLPGMTWDTADPHSRESYTVQARLHVAAADALKQWHADALKRTA